MTLFLCINLRFFKLTLRKESNIEKGIFPYKKEQITLNQVLLSGSNKLLITKLFLIKRKYFIKY